MTKRRTILRSGPDPVDVHVGLRIRSRRSRLGMSQGTLAEEVGLTFQQIQKYERGSNRVSASMLFRIARCLSVPIPYFFQGLPDADNDLLELPEPEPHQAYAASVEGQRLLIALGALPEDVRKRLASLATTVARKRSELAEDEGQKACADEENAR